MGQATVDKLLLVFDTYPGGSFSKRLEAGAGRGPEVSPKKKKTHRFKIRRVQAGGLHIPFHLDVTSKTMQVPLNGDHQYEGGQLVFLNELGVHMPSRPQGSCTIHEWDIVHGVTALTSGVRYGLYVLTDDDFVQ